MDAHKYLSNIIIMAIWREHGYGKCNYMYV